MMDFEPENSRELETHEDARLAPYAMLHSLNGGRLRGPEEGHYRTCYQRDRDRVIHSKAFRRLGYKTQVFVNSEGDNYRTRLTHSLEVAQIARSVSAAMNLNRDFAEAVALAHDLGHTPFGHAGQETLHELMRNHGGFEHNCQSLRVVTTLETRYLEYNGLNLSRATLKGMMKHACEKLCGLDVPELKELCEERRGENPALEAAVVDQCDRIAYLHHDLEDGVDSRYIHFEDLFEMESWKELYRRVQRNSGEEFLRVRREVRIRTVLRKLLNEAITDLIRTSSAALQRLDPKNQSEILSMDPAAYPVQQSREMASRLKEMQQFLFARLYRDPGVVKMSRRGSRIIEALFHEYIHNPEILPSHVQERIQSGGLHRVVADYIAGMTDRFALREFLYIAGGDLRQMV